MRIAEKVFSIYKVMGNMLIRVNVVQVCEARDDDSSTDAGNIIYKKFRPLQRSGFINEILISKQLLILNY